MSTNDKDTYFSRAQADADLGAQGRFKRETTTKVIGVPSHPPQPANSPWASDPVPPNPASDQLGYSIDAMEPTGSAHEIQASLDPTLKPPEVLPPTVEVRVGEPVVGVANLPASSSAGSTTSMKRRVW
jgi:hypothetical protein